MPEDNEKPFVIKSYNTSTGHVETVSGPLVGYGLFRDALVSAFAANDHSGDHAYFASDCIEIESGDNTNVSHSSVE